MERDQIQEIIRASRPYRKYKKILQRVEGQLDLAALESEIRNIHFSRTIRNLKPTEINQKNMIEASLKEVQGRARLVEIKTSLMEHKFTLEDMVRAVRSYLHSEYGIKLKGIKTRTDRKEYFERYFRSADRFLTQLDYLIEMIKTYVEDIDQAGYKFTNLVNLLEMIYQKERTI